MTLISLVDILSLTDRSFATILEGEEYFNSKLLLAVGIKCQHDSTITCAGLAARTSEDSSNPHEVECTIDLEVTPHRVVELFCSCSDENVGRCKHCIALLIFLNRVDEDELPDLNCAEYKKHWETQKKSDGKSYGEKRLIELCRGQLLHTHTEPITPEMKKKWTNILMNCRK